MELTSNALKIHKTTEKLASSIALSINGDIMIKQILSFSDVQRIYNNLYLLRTKDLTTGYGASIKAKFQ
jgi:hypothetical protein